MNVKKLIATILFSALVSPLAAYADGDSKAENNFERRSEARASADQGRQVRIDRRERTNPYPATPFSSLGGGEASRYRTDQAWSRGRSHWYGYYGSRRSDIPTTGYTSPPR
jgi:hypothetical protein